MRVPAASRVASVVALLALSVWMGGLLALGAVVAPVVFSMVSWPANADAMTVVFRRFDLVAMACAAVVLAAEALPALAGARPGRSDHVRAALAAVAAAAAVVEGTVVSPRIAVLHTAGAVRGVGAAGEELARLHGLAEMLGKTEVVVLAVVIALRALAPSAAARSFPRDA
jgi:hypothetical protein